MKLLCVTHGPAYAPATNGHWMIEFGQTYEAIKDYMCPRWGLYYILSHDPHYGYAAEHFVELPDDEELEEYTLTKEDRTLKALAELCPDMKLPADSEARMWEGIRQRLKLPL